MPGFLSNLPLTSRVPAKRMGGFNPLTDESNLLAFWRFTATGGVDVDIDGSDGVSKIYDKEATANNFEQTTAARRPLRVASQLNGEAIMRLDSGNTEWIGSDQANSTWNLLHDGTSYTIYILYNTEAASPNKVNRLFGSTTARNEYGFFVDYDDRSGSGKSDALRYWMFNGTGAAFMELDTANDTFPTNAWALIAATFDGTTGKLFVNASQVGSQAKSGSAAANDATEQLTIGNINGIIDCDGAFGYIAIVSGEAHDTTEQDKWVTYTNSTYGLSL